MLKAVLTKAVTDGQSGEVAVSFRPERDASGVRLTVTMAVEGAAERLAFIPTADHGGYLLERVAAGTRVDRVFTVKPIDAEVGSIHRCRAHARFAAGEEHSAEFAVHVEARPEVYAALGAVEHARRVLVGAYDSLKQLGKEVHRGAGTVLPSAPRDAVHETLHPDTVQWALDMIESGTRQFSERAAQRRRKT
jgi:hypothetical protein